MKAQPYGFTSHRAVCHRCDRVQPDKPATWAHACIAGALLLKNIANQREMARRAKARK